MSDGQTGDIYIFFICQNGLGLWRGMAERKVIQKLSFIRVGRYGHFRTEWTSLKAYPDSQTARFFIGLICKNHGKISFPT